MDQKVIFTDRFAQTLNPWLNRCGADGVFTIADTNTARFFPEIAESLQQPAKLIVTEAGDENKTLQAAADIWTALVENGATRHSAVINLGGGMVTDLGGFAAATFKRGLRFVNIPTTLLGAVDAAVGGKTGFNFHGLKNEIGVFRPADMVIITPHFYSTLPPRQILSGYGEVLKHALLSGENALTEALACNPLEIASNPSAFERQLKDNVLVKQRIVRDDPTEKGLRKALNLGHTAAHAFESLAFERNLPLPHGFAVAYGLVMDLVLSHTALGASTQTLYQVARFVKEHYPAPQFSCKDYTRLLDFMKHDKKNASAGKINFSLLHSPGKPQINVEIPPLEIEAALDVTADLLQ